MSNTEKIKMLQKRLDVETKKAADRSEQIQILQGKLQQYEVMSARLSTLACALALRLQPNQQESVHLFTAEQLEQLTAHRGEVRETEDGGMVFSVCPAMTTAND